MVEFTRAHERVQDRVFAGQSHLSEGGALTRSVEIYVPRSINRDFDILIHIRGVATTAKHAVESVDRELVLAMVNNVEVVRSTKSPLPDPKYGRDSRQ